MNEKILLAYFAAHASRDDMMAHQECDVKVGINPYCLYYAYPNLEYRFDDPDIQIKRIKWNEYCADTAKYRLIDNNGVKGGLYSDEELKMKYALNMIWKLREFEKLLDAPSE